MPPLVDKKCPFCAVWDGFTHDGEPIERELYPEQLLPYITRGFSPDEIASALDAPIEAVEHSIMLIPQMMTWRRQELKHHYTKNPEEQKMSLPEIPTNIPSQAPNHIQAAPAISQQEMFPLPPPTETIPTK